MLEQLNLNSFTVALILTLFAGLSTGIGALIAFTSKAGNKKLLSWALGLSAGVMTYLSFVEMLPDATAELQHYYQSESGGWAAFIAFFSGIAFIAIIDWLIPEHNNPHELPKRDVPHKDIYQEKSHLKRQGVLLALALGIHNFPEGMATFISALDGWSIALPIVIAIAIHNIPEGIAVSIPIYHATGKKSKAMRYALLSGLAEPAGALIGGLILLPFWNDVLCGFLMAFVAGIMIYISFDELLPGSHAHGHHHLAISGVISGMAIMGISLLLL